MTGGFSGRLGTLSPLVSSRSLKSKSSNHLHVEFCHHHRLEVDFNTYVPWTSKFSKFSRSMQWCWFCRTCLNPICFFNVCLWMDLYFCLVKFRDYRRLAIWLILLIIQISQLPFLFKKEMTMLLIMMMMLVFILGHKSLFWKILRFSFFKDVSSSCVCFNVWFKRTEIWFWKALNCCLWRWWWRMGEQGGHNSEGRAC